MTLKERYKQFKAWQLNACAWSYDEHETHHCVNCDSDFAGNFCPNCSQKAGLSKISWKSVMQSVAEVWGMHNRSLLYSLWQLIFRPGYFVSDYINGKRQVSFPPVKMLAIMGVVSVIIDHMFPRTNAMMREAVNGKNESALLNQIQVWLDTSPGWGSLCIASLFIIPTWFLFRYSPRNAKHTLPQGFFIQVLLANMVLVADDLGDFFGGYFYLLIPLCYFYAYRQLFGYRFWGNFWRVAVLMFSSLMSVASIMLIIERLTTNQVYSTDDNIAFVLFLILSTVPVIIGYFIGKKSFTRSSKKKQAEQEAQEESSTCENIEKTETPQETT